MSEQKHLPAQRSADQKIAEFAGGKFTAEQVAVIRSTVAAQSKPEAQLNNAELCVYLAQAARAKLDPFSRQIYAIKRFDRQSGTFKMSIQTGIDGFRSIAERCGGFAGSDDYVFDTEEGAHPNKATCTVHRIVNGLKVSTTRTVRWKEFKGIGPMWERMSWHMLGKVAEAHALRAAFPNDLSGLFTDDEMGQADRGNATPADFTVRGPAIGGAVDELRAVEVQAELEGREHEMTEPDFDVEPKGGPT